MNIGELKRVIGELKVSLKKQNKLKFSCESCYNQHVQIYNWLVELKDYMSGTVGENKDDPLMPGFLSLDDAIEHTKDVIESTDDKQEKLDHKQLLSFLSELKKYRANH